MALVLAAKMEATFWGIVLLFVQTIEVSTLKYLWKQKINNEAQKNG